MWVMTPPEFLGISSRATFNQPLNQLQLTSRAQQSLEKIYDENFHHLRRGGYVDTVRL